MRYRTLWKLLATRDRHGWQARLIRDLYRHLYATPE